MTTTRVWVAAALAGSLAAAGPARADLTPIEEATEVMMESQGLQAVYLALAVGPDDLSPLRFTSRVDGDSFRYELEAGSTYLGLSATWVTTGSRVGATRDWTWETVGAVGAVDLGGLGTMGPFVGVDPPATYDLFDPFRPIKLLSDVTYTEKKGKFLSDGTITVRDLILGDTKTKHKDELITEGKDKGKWKWDTGVITDKFKHKEVKVVAAGFSPLPDGGVGTFATTITAVPEPAAGGLALTGAVGLGVWRRFRPAAGRS